MKKIQSSKGLPDIEQLPGYKGKVVKEGHKCPSCNFGVTIRDVIQFSSGNNKETIESHWVVCNHCKTAYMDYSPTYYQRNFLEDVLSHKYTTIGFIGGFALGKSDVGEFAFSFLTINTPNSLSLLGGPDDDTVKKLILTLLKFYPNSMIQKLTRKELVLTNGHIIEFQSSGENKKEGNLKHRTASYIYDDEFDQIGAEQHKQKLKRLRGKETYKKIKTISPLTGEEEEKGIPLHIFTANAEIGYMTDQIFYKAGRVVLYDNKSFIFKKDEINSSICIHLGNTDQNYHLPPNYIKNSSVGETPEEIRRKYYCEFHSGAGLVYGLNMAEFTVTDEDYVINENTKHGISIDFGSNSDKADPTHIGHYIYNQGDKCIIKHREYRFHNGETTDYCANFLSDLIESIGVDNMMIPPLGDRQGEAKGPGGESYFSLYQKKGIYIQQANLGSYYYIDPGITKLRDFIKEGWLKFNSACTITFDEFSTYKKDPKTGKPIGKKDHAMDETRYFIINMPDRPEDIQTASVLGIGKIAEFRNSMATNNQAKMMYSQFKKGKNKYGRTLGLYGR